MTLTMTDPLEVLAAEPDDGLLHGAHIECQLERDEVTMACGLVDSWLGFSPESTLPRCPTCWDPDTKCPVCGA